MADPADQHRTDSGQADPPTGGTPSVGDIAELYLGNLLYALERCAMSLEGDEKPLDAAFYRAIGRKLADAHGRTRKA